MKTLEYQLSRIATELRPTSKPFRVRRLGGGVLTTMHAFDLVSDRHVMRLVLRRYRPGEEWRNVMLGMLRTLAILEAEGIPAPRALWSDADGDLFGVPAVVLTRLRGAPTGLPGDSLRWARQMGDHLARIHALPTTKYDLSYLPPAFEVASTLLDRAYAPTPAVAAHPLARSVLPRLRELGAALELGPPAFTHGDFWPGQAIWWRGHLEGIVDWDFARLDDAGIDIGYCRMDIAIMTSPAVADEFLRAYEKSRGESVMNLRFWDLIAAYQAMEHAGTWHRQGFTGIGRPDLHGTVLERKLADFIGAA
jgi:aminoglycoside phosphotransferase (APT) family kinase protein